MLTNSLPPEWKTVGDVEDDEDPAAQTGSRG